jgi:hypothetical protein
VIVFHIPPRNRPSPSTARRRTWQASPTRVRDRNGVCNVCDVSIHFMTGFGPTLEDGPGGDPTARWAGVARILGPRWAQLPNLALGLLGVQLMWSIEMSYGA